MVEHLEPEQLAAFIDGTLPAPQREAVLQRLAASPELYREFLEAEGLLAEMNPSGPVGEADFDSPALQKVPESKRSTRSNKRGLLMFIAAPMLLAAALAVVVLRPDTTTDPVVETVFARMLPGGTPGSGAVQQRLGGDWNAPSWSVVRGSDDEVSRETRAFRIGARIAHVEIAVAAADTVATQESMAALARSLESVDLGAPLAAEARNLHVPLQAAAARNTLYERIREVTGQSHAVDLGIWLEAAKLATMGADTAFFLSTAPARLVWRDLSAEIRKVDSLSAWAGVLAAVDALYAPGGQPSIERARAGVAQAFAAIPR